MTNNPTAAVVDSTTTETEDNVLQTTSVMVNLDGTPVKGDNNQQDPHTPPESVIPGSAAAVRRHVLSLDLQAPRDVSAEEIRHPERCVLEDFTPCSKSHLWKLMMSFYDRKGPDSWSQGIVPHFITCNTFIAKSYVKVLHGFIMDGLRKNSPMPLDPNEPLYIIELGAGSGKFSFFMIKVLEEMQQICDFPFKNMKFVMTDFTEANFQFWQNHPALTKYFENGQLDAGIFDAVNDRTIKLWKANKVLGPNSCKNPIVIVANYLFDTLYHDIFQVDHGILKEGLVSTGSKHSEEPDPLEPDIIQRLDNHYKYVPVSSSYYQQGGGSMKHGEDEEGDEKHLKRILDWYVDRFQEQAASILIPIGALRALRHLGQFSNGRALIISGDKGNNNPDQFLGLMDPHIAVHGSFSLMVNYHAIGAWFTSRGGFALHNPQEEASLKVSTFVLSPEMSLDGNIDDEVYLGDTLNQLDLTRSQRFPFLRQAFMDNVDQFGPNDYFVLQKSLKEDMTQPPCPLRTVVSILKLGDWDPDVFFKFRDVILTHAPSCGIKLRNDLCRGIPRVWSNYYLMDMDKDIAFEIGRFYYGIREYERALHFYKESITTVGKHHVTYHNQGLCYYSLGFLDQALELFQIALSMNSEYEKARNWIEKVENDLKRRNAPLVTAATTSSSPAATTATAAAATAVNTENTETTTTAGAAATVVDAALTVENGEGNQELQLTEEVQNVTI